MYMSHHQTTGQNHYIKVANKSFENVADLMFLGLMVTYQNCICKEIKSRLKFREDFLLYSSEFFAFVPAV
jgi:hypothetical protein